MKAIFTLLFLGASIAQASVDYVAIGALVTAGKKDIAFSKAGVACLMKDYAESPTCAKIEKINVQTNNLLNTQSFVDFHPSCGDSYDSSSGVHYFHYNYLNKVKELAKDAAANDPVNGVIQNLEASHNQLVNETNDILAKAKLQEAYVTQCLLGQEPPSASILEQLCK